MDSRLRGNDVGGCGNGVSGCGNDVGGCGNGMGGGVGMVAGGFTVWGAIRTGELGAILPIDQTEPENGYLASTAVTCFDAGESGMIP